MSEVVLPLEQDYRLVLPKLPKVLADTTVLDPFEVLATEGDIRLGDGVTPGGIIIGGQGAAVGSVLDVRQFGAGGGDASAAIQAALDAAAAVAPSRVVATDRQYLAVELVVPTGVTFECDIKIAQGAEPGTERNVIKVRSGASVIGSIEGSGRSDVEVIERGIFVAEEGCTDVYLDVTVTKTTVGVGAGGYDLSKPPRRWSGEVRCVDIAGFIPAVTGNGYGLNGTLCDSNLVVTGTNVPRHTLYLAAGASDNNFIVHCTGSRYIPIALASDPGQAGCHRNNIQGFVRDHKGSYDNLNCYGAVIRGWCDDNTLNLAVTASAPLYAGVRLQAQGNGTFGRRNNVAVKYDGSLNGARGVVEHCSCDATTIEVSGRVTHTAPGLACAVWIGRNDGFTPTGAGPVAASIRAINLTCVSGFQHQVAVASSGPFYGAVDLGEGSIRCSGTFSVSNVYMTGVEGQVRGWIYKTDFARQVASVAAGATGSAVIAFDNPLSQRRIFTGSAQPFADPGAGAPSLYIQPATDTQATVKVKNNDSDAQTFNVSGRFYGF